MTLSAGTRLGPYEILAPLGAGGMGEVYRARDPRLSREIAIKVLPAEVASDPERLKRFEQEARSASALNHPNIVSVYDIGQTDSMAWMAMELVLGKSLRELLAAGPLPVKKVLSTAAQMAEGLASAHAAGIVHRDLKPENVMVTPDGLVKILDFGLAKLSPAVGVGGPQSVAPTVTQQTTPGVILGTAGYMSPEQAIGRAVDFRSDQFSFGAILYEMVSGERAFAGGGAVETLAAIIRDDPRPLASVNPKAPAPLCWIVERCLSKDPEERYGSTRDLGRDLQGLREHLTTAAEPEASTAMPAPARKRISRPAFIAGLLLLGLLLMAAWKLFQPGSGAPPGAVRARSIAVLPLENLGGRPEDEYFADGMTESLITDLAKVPGMLVIARNSVFRYKGEKIDIKRVGDELDVNYVMEGSVQRSGDRVRINAQLIDAESGFHVWADRYDRSLEDVFALQDDISTKIAGALRVRLAPSEAEKARAVPTKNLEAYDTYLRGKHLSQTSLGDAGQEGAISLFERAVALDPGFALAHAALASGYVNKLFSRDPRREWEEKALAEIERALSLDPDLPEAYLARAQVLWTRLNNFPHERAAKDLRRALSLNPSLADAHGHLASIYFHVGLFEKSEEESQLARKLDPHEPWNTFYLAAAYLFWQKYGSALAEFERYESAGRRHPWKALALSNLNRDEEAFAFLEDFLGIDPKDPAFERQRWESALAVYALLLARAGDDRKAEQYIARAIESDRGLGHFHHSEYNIASAYALMDKPRLALEWLEKAADHGFPCYPLFASDPKLSSLRGDPAYQSLLRKMKAEWEHYRATL